MVKFEEMQNNDVYKNLLNGKWIESNSNKLIEVKAPHDGSFLGKIQAMTKEEVDEARLLWENQISDLKHLIGSV